MKKKTIIHLSKLSITFLLVFMLCSSQLVNILVYAQNDNITTSSGQDFVDTVPEDDIEADNDTESTEDTGVEPDDSEENDDFDDEDSDHNEEDELNEDSEDDEINSDYTEPDQNSEDLVDTVDSSIPISVTDEDSLIEAVSAIDNSGTILLENDIGIITTVSIPANKSITITSKDNAFTIQHLASPPSTPRHFKVTGELILQNIVLDGNSTAGGISVTGGSLIINDGTKITNCYSFTGAGVELNNKSTFLMNGGTISYNKTPEVGTSGGGVTLKDSTFTMDGGIIEHNSSTWGGGVHVGADGQFILNKGSIRKNETVKEFGGGVHVFIHGTFIMNGGDISNNYSKGIGGGVFVGQSYSINDEPTDWCKFIMNGGVIENNSAQNQGGGISAQWVGSIEINGGLITKNSAPAGGAISVLNSVHEDGGVSLWINGGEISHNKATTHQGGALYAVDSLQTNNSTNITIGAIGKPGPNIHDNTAYGQGGAIMLNSNRARTFCEMISGDIYENTAGTLGGGICIYNGSHFTMKNGLIRDNTAGTSGGGIATFGSTAVNTTLIMTGGTVSSNHAKSVGAGGGGIYLNTDTLAQLTDVKIDNNDSVNKNGGGIYLASSATLEMKQSTISNNKAQQYGGGIFTEEYSYANPADTTKYSSLELDNQTVFTGNTAEKAYTAPSNANDFSKIKYAQTSISNGENWMHPINNYDINYEDPSSPITLVQVKYDANGGTGSYTDTFPASTNMYTILSAAKTGISYSGYTFTGWCEDADGSSKIYSPGNEFEMAGRTEVTLYAQWKKNGGGGGGGVTPDPDPDPEPTPNPDPDPDPGTTTVEPDESTDPEPDTWEPEDPGKTPGGGSGSNGNSEGEPIPQAPGGQKRPPQTGMYHDINRIILGFSLTGLFVSSAVILKLRQKRKES